MEVHLQKKGNLTAHQKTHSNQDRKYQFNCEVCKKYGSDHRSNFERHLKKHKTKKDVVIPSRKVKNSKNKLT